MLKFKIFGENSGMPCAFLLGGFDGLHVGHEKLVEEAKKYGLPIGIMQIVGGKRDALFTESERLAIYKRKGVDFCLTLEFTDEVKNTSKEDFIKALCATVNVARFVCGRDFRFGRNAEGTPSFIEEFTGVKTTAVELYEVDGEKVGCSHVKEYIRSGDVEEANRYLSEPFSLTAKVEEGRRVGRTLGFPTANTAYPKEKCPLADGVYAVHAFLDGARRVGIANVGACPTFGVEERKVESHFADYFGDLYGKEITVYFDKYLRGIRKFDGADGLIKQLEEDLRRAKEL